MILVNRSALDKVRSAIDGDSIDNGADDNTSATASIVAVLNADMIGRNNPGFKLER